MKPSTAPPRRFAASAAGQAWELTSYHATVNHMRVPPDVVAGLDLLVDEGFDIDKAAELVIAAHRDGRNAEAFARHVLKLRRGLRT